MLHDGGFFVYGGGASEGRQNLTNRGFGLRSVATAEEIEVIQYVVEVVYGFTNWFHLWKFTAIGFVEAGAEPSEEMSECHVSFAITEVGGRIIDNGSSAVVEADIAAPEIPVKQ